MRPPSATSPRPHWAPAKAKGKAGRKPKTASSGNGSDADAVWMNKARETHSVANRLAPGAVRECRLVLLALSLFMD